MSDEHVIAPVFLVVGSIMLHARAHIPATARRAPAPPPAFPTRYGSSLKYSKFRPHSGMRLMFTAGPRMHRHILRAGTPRPAPAPSVRSNASVEAEHAVAHAAGKHTAVMLSLMPRWSASWSCLRSPCGPSDHHHAPGCPAVPRPSDARNPRPNTCPAFSSSVICATSSFILRSKKTHPSHFSVRPQPPDAPLCCIQHNAAAGRPSRAAVCF